MDMDPQKVRKILDRKIQQLYDITADLDILLAELETEFYRVCIFGSARIDAESPMGQQVRELASALATRGADIVTGGGPGLMLAANKGAKEGSDRVRSIGLPIQLPFEEHANVHLDVKHHHRRFSSRLDEFMRISHAVVVTPGGIGTCLEMFFTLQVLQVNHARERPVLLLGREMWGGLLDWLRESPLKRNLVDAKDLERLQVVDSVTEVVDFLAPCIEKFYRKRTR